MFCADPESDFRIVGAILSLSAREMLVAKFV
jgi:hypothetical protein